MVFKALAALDEDWSTDGELVKKAKFHSVFFNQLVGATSLETVTKRHIVSQNQHFLYLILHFGRG
ncbi:hypothetical protein RchiOBHm_Chr7g0215491 [Rosa chinensis]|uniref:Uncharacterized protein n=1 Tax=Rosa chinensis TaxID=74649 RepID=A0A2P6PBH9_ROSCH|nr:hypothetical protein RchiOBHm_Chr7g0215491 [Rosa chinensis]